MKQRTFDAKQLNYVYLRQTGEVLRQVTNGYRWMLRHMWEIERVDIAEKGDGGAYVDLVLDDGLTAFRWHWASCAIAQGFLRKPRYGFDVHVYAYHNLY